MLRPLPGFPGMFRKSISPFIRLKSTSYAALSVVEPNPASNFPLYDSKSLPRNQDSHDWPTLLWSIKKIDTYLDRKDKLRHFSWLLGNCASKGSFNEGRAIHGKVIRSGVDPDSHLWISLVNVYSKYGSVGFAHRVFDEMPEKDVVSWTVLITGFVAQGYGRDGVNLFSEMWKDGVKPNEFTLATGLKACSMCLELGLGKQIHAQVNKVGNFSDLFVGSALVDLYAKCGEMELADSVFHWMPMQNVVSWNALLNGYAEVGDGQEVLKLFCCMTGVEMKFSKFTLSTVLKGCGNSGKLREGQSVHCLAIKVGCELNQFLCCNLVDMYSRCGLVDYALKVFIGIRNPDVVAWSAMITSLAQQRRSGEVAKLFNMMRCAGVSPNQFALASLVRSATDLVDLHYGESIHACICKYGFESHNSTGNSLVTMYMKNGCLQDGKQIFEAMNNRDSVSWNALSCGPHDYDTCNQKPKLFYQMLGEGFKPNMYTFISVLRSCSSLLDVSFGKQVHCQIIKNNVDGNSFVGTALIDMYAKSGCWGDADAAFNRLLDRDLLTWTAIISNHIQIDRMERAIKCFTQMQQEGINPNECTIAICLSGCSRVATLESGRQLHSISIKSGHLGDMFVGTALVDMYWKCGCLEDAKAIFDRLVSRDTVSWNTMICGYSKYGMGDKAIEVFRMMLEEGTVPDEVTFIGVLTACSHMGWIEEGKEYFTSLSEVYRISPTVQHYTCMVDILGRAGRFNDVESFVEEMKLAPYALIWQTILGACSKHGNVEFGRRAAEKLFVLEPKTDMNYILLSNIFAAQGMWDDFRKVRSLMSSRTVKKEPACSWVEVDGEVHVFKAQGSSHAKIREIYLKLAELEQVLYSLGYKPKTEHVLHDITDREKLDHLYYHTERLALAFALISTNPYETIRIFKNIHVCEDCHDVMKLVSNITNRDIVIRDMNHFHHFKSGTCSCKDYW